MVFPRSYKHLTCSFLSVSVSVCAEARGKETAAYPTHHPPQHSQMYQPSVFQPLPFPSSHHQLQRFQHPQNHYHRMNRNSDDPEIFHLVFIKVFLVKLY